MHCVRKPQRRHPAHRLTDVSQGAAASASLATDGVFTCIVDARAQLGECPLWSARKSALYWVDIKGRALHRFCTLDHEHTVAATHEEIGCIAFDDRGGFIAGGRRGVWRLDERGAVLKRLASNPEDVQTSRFNDGRADPAGRFLLGTIDEPKNGSRAHLYRFDARGLVPLVGGLLTSNGLAFSPDGRWLYHSDTPTFTIYRYGYDAKQGELSERRVFARLNPTASDRGRPDGAAVDSEGCYWTALYEGGRVQRYSPDGALLAQYDVPARCPTMPAFGGADLRTLFVTSARAGRSDEELARFPHSGGVFAMRVDVPGLPEPVVSTGVQENRS